MSVKQPICVHWKCKNAKLVKLKPGKSFQTDNGFIINKTGEDRHICPKCAAFYVIGETIHFWLGKNAATCESAARLEKFHGLPKIITPDRPEVLLGYHDQDITLHLCYGWWKGDLWEIIERLKLTNHVTEVTHT